MRTISVLALAAALAPGFALAQDGTVSIGYGQIDPDGGSSLDVFSITGTVNHDLAFAPGLSFSATGRYSDIEDGGDATNIFGNLTYDINNGVYVGVYGQLIDIDDLDNLESYGLILGYEAGPFAASVYYGQTDGAGQDVDDYGIAASYDGGDWTVYGSYQSADGDDDEIEAYGLAGSYTFAGSVSLFAAYASLDTDDSFVEADAFGIGASYAFEGLVAGNPLVVSAEYTNLDFDGGNDVDGFGLVLTVPFGGASSVIPDQSLAGAIANPGYSAIGTFVETSF